MATPRRRVWGESEIVGPRHDFRETIMLEFLRKHVDLDSVSTVLDAGCGSASLSRRLLTSRPEFNVKGFDPAPRHEQFITPIPNFSFYAGGFDSIPEQVASHSYDLVVCGEVLEHVEDDRSALKEIHGLLAPGGSLLLSVPHRSDYWGAEDEWAGHQRRYEKEDLRHKLEAAGLSVVEIITWGFPVVWLYDRFVFSRMVRKEGSLERKGALQAGAVWLLRRLFSMDRIFLGSPRGIGLMALARKPQTRLGQ